MIIVIIVVIIIMCMSICVYYIIIIVVVVVTCRSSELVKVFAEDAYSVALHPSGLTILLGFADKLRLMTVLMDDFRQGPLNQIACVVMSWMHGIPT